MKYRYGRELTGSKFFVVLSGERILESLNGIVFSNIVKKIYFSWVETNVTFNWILIWRLFACTCFFYLILDIKQALRIDDERILEFFFIILNSRLVKNNPYNIYVNFQSAQRNLYSSHCKTILLQSRTTKYSLITDALPFFRLFRELSKRSRRIKMHRLCDI